MYIRFTLLSMLNYLKQGKPNITLLATVSTEQLEQLSVELD